MKRKITLLFAAVAGFFATNAQVVLNESFTATWSPSGAGWTATNVSVPASTSTAGWFQGNGAGTFTANSGGINDYYASNFQAGTGTSDLNTWLVTPTVNLVNGAVIQFATRTTTSTTIYPDRLQLRWSAGTGTAVGTTTAAPGTFTNMILDINPLYSTNQTPGPVNNGTVNGYPIVWTVYSTTLSGITGTVQGRFGFRYFVQNGGPNGANSDYVGVDDVMYSLPCTQPTININPPSASICSGATVNAFASGATTYTWNTGATTSSVALTPSVTTIYTVTGSSTPGCNSTKTIAVTVTVTPNVAVNNATTCPSTSVTLNASGAATYSWSTGATTSSISAPGTAATYTVTGFNGTCANTKTVSVSLGTALSVNASASSTLICAGSSATLTATGATSYTWLPSNASGATFVASPTVNTTYTVAGQTGACFGAAALAISVNTVPALTSTTGANPACTNQTVVLGGQGATSYTWTLGTQSVAVNPVSLTTGTTQGVFNLVLFGTNAAGCTSSIAVTQSVSLCTDIKEANTVASNLSVYPNPFTTEIYVAGVKGSVEVVNMLGQVVYAAAVNENEKINTTNFAKGVYFVKVRDEQGVEVKTTKLVKN